MRIKAWDSASGAGSLHHNARVTAFAPRARLRGTRAGGRSGALICRAVMLVTERLAALHWRMRALLLPPTHRQPAHGARPIPVSLGQQLQQRHKSCQMKGCAHLQGMIAHVRCNRPVGSKPCTRRSQAVCAQTKQDEGTEASASRRSSGDLIRQMAPGWVKCRAS